MARVDLLLAEDTDLLSDAAVARTRAHPQFRAAAEAHASAALASYEADDAASRWMIKDLGRAALCGAAVILDGWPGGLTVAGLAASAAATHAASRGRVLAFVQYAQGAGRISLPPGPEPWIHRRLALTPAFTEPLGRRMYGAYEAASRVAPEIADVLPMLRSEAGVRMAVAASGLALAARPDLTHNPGGSLRQIFIARDGGMRMLQHLLLSQPDQRTRLLQEAVLSRADLARRYGVSRTHINRLLADAQAAGALRLAAADRVVFTPAFSQEVEAYVAGQFQLMRLIAQGLLAAAP